MANQEKKRIRLIHTSDLHLGENYSRNTSTLDAPAYQILRSLVDTSIRLKASLLIIAGDLFDNNRLHSAIVELAAQELARALVPVIILPGNHDCLVQDSVYQRVDFSKLAPNIRIFTKSMGERFSFPEFNLAIWGRAADSYCGHFRPMAGIPPRGSEQWQIAAAHGHYVGDSFDQIYSLQISEEEIAQSCYDYVALGHWGLFRCVCDGSVKAYYSGSAPLTGSVAMVDLLTDGGVQVKSHSLLL